jgi:hypothetical protein
VVSYLLYCPFDLCGSCVAMALMISVINPKWVVAIAVVAAAAVDVRYSCVFACESSSWHVD